MSDDSKKVFLGNSAQPKPIEMFEKSLQPLAPSTHVDPSISGTGASTQPKAPPLTSQQAKPPSSED